MRKLFHARGTTLGVYINVTLLGVTTLILFGFGAYNYDNFTYHALARLSSEANLIASRLGESLVLPMWNMDYDSVKYVLLSEMRARDVYSLTIRGPEYGEVIEGLVRDNLWRPVADKSQPDLSNRIYAHAAIMRGNTYLGRVEVSLTRQFFEAERNTFLRVTVATILIVDMAIVIILFLVMRTLLVTPLQTIQAYAARVSSGNLDCTEISGAFRGELADLKRHLEQMVAALLSQVEEVRRKNMEAAENARKAMNSESRLRALFENAPVGIYQSTPEGRYLQVNPEFVSIFGYSSPEEILRIVTDIHSMMWVDGSERVKMSALLEEKGQIIGFEARNKRRDGSIIWTSRNLRAVRDLDGIIQMYDGFITDITARKNAEEYLMSLNIELERRVQSRTAQLEQKNSALLETLENLKKAQDQLVQSEKMASLGGLVAGVAHEINTPVGLAITTVTHMREQTRTLEEAFAAGRISRTGLEGYLHTSQEAAGMILSNLNRAAELIRGFKKVAVDRTSEERRSFLLKQYLGEVLLSLHPRLKRTKIRVEVCCEENLRITSLPGVFSQIVTNLVTNSLSHAYDEGQEGLIVLEARLLDGVLELTYSDNGKGMAPEVRTKVFEPFFTTARAKGGTGLGLHILFNLVTQTLNGMIRCESELGLGTKFIMSIPLT